MVESVADRETEAEKNVGMSIKYYSGKTAILSGMEESSIVEYIRQYGKSKA